MKWYYVQAGQQRGPVADRDLPQLLAQGTINPRTLVWHEGMTNWQPYSEVVLPGAPLPVLDLPRTDPIPESLTDATTKPALSEVVCSECHQVFTRDHAVLLGTHWVCANCKDVYIQRLTEGAPRAEPVVQIYAGFWIRFAAYFIDQLVVAVLNTAVGLALGLIATTNAVSTVMAGRSVMLLVVAGAAGMLIGLIYEAWFTVKYGATPGKMALRLKVISVEQASLSWGISIGRYFAKMLSGCPTLFIGFILVGTDQEKRGLHDQLCNTRVILS